ncbi:flagellar biosynthesis protein FlhF [Lachnospiraceae bacterium]|nr:flagellar biosynthesis protein FlhF [Lachnospiraceae bacterium]
MIIKKFTGKNEEDATALAKKELGNSVVIMNVKTLKKGGLFGIFKAPQVEVTAAVEEVNDGNVSNNNPVTIPQHLPKPFAAQLQNTEASPEKDILRSARPARRVEDWKKSDIIQDDKEEGNKEKTRDEKAIEEKLDSIHTMIEQQMKRETRIAEEKQKHEDQDGEETEEPEEDDEITKFLKLIRKTLLDNDVEEEYVDEVMDEASKLRKPGISIDYMLSSIYQKLILKFGQTDRIEKENDLAEIIFFLGPTGVGKTTTIAKIASRLCVQQKKRVALITTDTYRVKAADQLRTYADILNIPFKIVYVLDDMKAAVEELKNFDFILVDTAGHSPKNDERIETQRQFIDVAKEVLKIKVYLVLSVTTKYRDLLNIAENYSRMVRYQLIFTKLDETTSLGNMLNLKLRTGSAVAYITNGQDVPEDIEVFNPQNIVRVLLGGKEVI